MTLKDDLLKDLDAAYDDFMAALGGLGTDEMARPFLDGWGARDLGAHVIGWFQELGGVLDRMGRGERPVPEGVDYNAVDEWNAKFAEQHRNDTAPQLVAALQESRNFFVSACQRLPDDRVVEGKTAWRLIKEAIADHLREHAGHIRAWRQREGL